jgi:SAM-dependent methyltransferase
MVSTGHLVLLRPMPTDGGRGAQYRRKIYEVLWTSPVRSLLVRLPLIRRIYNGWARRHPFDAAHGIETSGSVSAIECAPNAAMAAQIISYGGSQPSIARAGIASLPDHHQYSFVDLGCGKGRALIVASEFPFRRLVGVEISPDLAEVARRNAAVVALRDSGRTPIEIVEGDATAVFPPTERVVYFMYHPFGRVLVGALVDNIERQLADGLRHAFLVYYNPVHGEVLDRSPHFSRWQAETIPYAADELGFGPDLSDTLVIWQTLPEYYPAHPSASRHIVVHESRQAARLANGP